MFCPKCGSQNADETKFCRGCGVELSGLLAPRTSRRSNRRSLFAASSLMPPVPGQEGSLEEKHIELFSTGIRALLIGFGYLIVSGVAFVISMNLAILSVFFLAFSFYGFGTGISRLIQARALKSLSERSADQANPSLTAGQADYIKPSQSIYETDDLLARPLSVTEHTTTHLEIDRDGEMFSSPKKRES